MNKRGVTLIEMMISLTIGVAVVGMAVGVAITQTRTQVAEEYRSDVDFRARKLHKLISRDVLLAGGMAASWDSITAVQVAGDTLTIRFSESESVRYFIDGMNRVQREGIPIASHVLSWGVTQDSIAVHVSLDMAANGQYRWMNGGNLYHRTYEWTVVPRNTYYRVR
jgi:Tfp pilus assembly protein PilW